MLSGGLCVLSAGCWCSTTSWRGDWQPPGFTLSPTEIVHEACLHLLQRNQVGWYDRVVNLLDLADAMDALEAESPRLHDVVQLHWFGGLKLADVASCLGVSDSTVEKDSRYALAWPNRKLLGVDDNAHLV